MISSNDPRLDAHNPDLVALLLDLQAQISGIQLPTPTPFDPTALQSQIDGLKAALQSAISAPVTINPADLQQAMTQIGTPALEAMISQIGADVAGMSAADKAAFLASLQGINATLSPPVVPPDNPPVWMTIPPNFFTFTQGKAQSISLGQFASDPDPADVLSISISGLLPSGITYNPATRSFDYDGVGLIGLASISATADDGHP